MKAIYAIKDKTYYLGHEGQLVSAINAFYGYGIFLGFNHVIRKDNEVAHMIACFALSCSTPAVRKFYGFHYWLQEVACKDVI